jgi:hypothetical protein
MMLSHRNIYNSSSERTRSVAQLSQNKLPFYMKYVAHLYNATQNLCTLKLCDLSR